MASIVIRKQLLNNSFLKNSSRLISSYNAVRTKNAKIDENSDKKDQLSRQVPSFYNSRVEIPKKTFLQESHQMDLEPFLIEGGKGKIRTAQIMPLYEG